MAADVAADVATGEAMGEAVGEAVTAGETQFCMRSHDPWISSTIAYMIAQGYRFPHFSSNLLGELL